MASSAAVIVLLQMFVTASATSLSNATLTPRSQNISTCATCVKVNTTCYNLTHLLDLQANFRKSVVIHKLGVLRYTDTLYFSYEPEISDPEYYKIGYVSLSNANNTGDLYGRNQLNFGTFDVDQDHQILYLGGSDGVYTYDLNRADNRLNQFSSRGDTILSVFFKGNIFFVRDSEKKIIQKMGDNFNVLLEYEPVKNFVINRNDVVVFLSAYGLFAHKSGELVRLSHNAFFRGLTIDLDGVVYAWWIDGIYKVVIHKNLPESSVEKVAHLPNIGAMTFDNDNSILFTTDKSLYKLVVTNVTTC